MGLYNFLHGPEWCVRLSYPFSPGQVNEAYEKNRLLRYPVTIFHADPPARPVKPRSTTWLNHHALRRSGLLRQRAAGYRDRASGAPWRPRERQRARSELRLDPHSPEPESCAAVDWTHDDCHFSHLQDRQPALPGPVLLRPLSDPGHGRGRIRRHLFECTVSLLQVQADHESQRKDGAPGNP